jgi:hypothetical protein
MDQMRITRITWSRTLLLAMALIFLAGALGNIIGIGSIPDDYRRWGYPAGFRYVTGALELMAAFLMTRRYGGPRTLGLLLGCGIMAAALATLLIHGEVTHALAPALILVVLVIFLIR